MPERVTALFERVQNRKEIERIRGAGDPLIILPAATDGEASLDGVGGIPASVGSCDWLVLADLRSAERFVALFEERSQELLQLDAVSVCAAGEAVSDTLRFSQVHTDLLPTTISAQAVFTAIVDYAGGKDRLEGLSFVIAYSGAGHYMPADEIRSAGALVQEVCLGAPRSHTREEATSIALVKGGGFDSFIFSSASDVYDLAELVFPDTIESVLKGAEAIAGDDLAWGALRERGVTARIRTPA
jgi:uroporphyrinogen-III synthase